MGNILRRKRDASTELEQITNNLKRYERQMNEWTERRQAALWYLAYLLFFIATIGSAYLWLKVEESKFKIAYCIGTFIAAILGFVVFRIVLRVIFNYLINSKRNKLKTLTERKAQIIEDVKENEKFKVAKEILEKYGNKEDIEFLNTTVKGSPKSPKSDSEEKKEDKGDEKEEPKQAKPEANPPVGAMPKTPGQILRTPLPNQPGQGPPMPIMTPLRNQIPGPGMAPLQTPMRGGPVRPFVNPNRTPLDKLVDYIIGDGPNNRYALICANCHTHNGMALSEEFDYMAYFCYKCNFFNPSKRMRRPSGRPSLPPQGIQQNFLGLPPNRASQQNLQELEQPKWDLEEEEDAHGRSRSPVESVQQDRRSTEEVKQELTPSPEQEEDRESNGTPSDPVPTPTKEEPRE